MKHTARKHTMTAIAALIAATACAPKNTKVLAQEKEYVPPTATSAWKIGGEFDKEEHTVAISVNGEHVIRGRFPPYTPHLSAEGKYDGRAVAAVCKFSSDIIAGKGGGWQTQLAGAIVAKSMNAAGNTCDVKVDGAAAATLYF